MKKTLTLFSALFLLALWIFSPSAYSAAYTVADVENVSDGILAYKETKAGVSRAQELIDGYLTDRAGLDAEWYVLALSQSGDYDFSRYESALLSYIDHNDIFSATSRQKYALALICADSSSRFISDTLNNSIGEQGVMSYIYGLHLLNNGYKSQYHTAESVISDLLSMRTSDGGWAVMGSRADTDVTAMALCALAPYYHRYSDAEEAINTATALLSSSQRENGGYFGFGGENCESTAQVLTALSCLGIDCNKDERFIKNGNTILDGLLSYRLSDGSFSHLSGGAADESATVQAYYALVSYLRLQKGQGSLYIIDRRSPENVKPAPNGGSSYLPPSQNDYSYAQDVPEEIIIHHIENIIIYEDDSSPTQAAESTAPPSEAATQAPTTASLAPSQAAPSDSTPSTATRDSATPDDLHTEKGGYKLPVILCLIALSLILLGILFALKKRNIKNFIFIAAVTAVLILFVLLTDFSSKESYYQTDEKSEIAGEVTLSILCDTIEDENNKYIPKDGVILSETTFSFSKGETVEDILIEAAKTHDIPLDITESTGYVRAINHLYEFDYGELSGWMYRVNGVTPSVGSNQYLLTENDRIEWLYTTDMGEDLNKIRN